MYVEERWIETRIEAPSIGALFRTTTIILIC